MPFDESDLDTILADAPNSVDVAVTLSGVALPSIRGIYSVKSEIVSPYEADMVVVLPSILVKASTAAGLTREHRLAISGITYKAYRDPQPDDAGFALIGLVKA